jgi:hypothetical protein
MADKHIWRLDACVVQENVQLSYDLLRLTGLWPVVAPAETCTVIGTHARGSSDLGLYPAPHRRSFARATLKNDSRGAFAKAVNMQAISTDIHQLTWWRVITVVCQRGERLIDTARKCQREKANHQY